MLVQESENSLRNHNTESKILKIQSLSLAQITGRIILRWGNPVSTFFSHTVIRRTEIDLTSGVTSTKEVYNGNGNFKIDVKLKPSTTYIYKLIAISKNGMHGPAQTIMATFKD